MTGIAVVLLALVVVVCAAAPFVVASALAVRAGRRAHLHAELSRLLGTPPARGQDST